MVQSLEDHHLVVGQVRNVASDCLQTLHGLLVGEALVAQIRCLLLTVALVILLGSDYRLAHVSGLLGCLRVLLTLCRLASGWCRHSNLAVLVENFSETRQLLQSLLLGCARG